MSPPRRALWILASAVLALTAHAEELRPLGDPSDPKYDTPAAAEGFRTTIFGRRVSVEPRDRLSITAWDVGAMAWHPAAESEHELPFLALYLWRRPDTDRFFRGTVSLLYNDLLYAHSLAAGSPWEIVLGFENDTTLTETALWADGERITTEELETGFVRGALGLGYRRQIRPGWRFEFDRLNPKAPDNMFAAAALVEPKYLYFVDGHETDPLFETPQDTFELQGRLSLRVDAFERNLLDLLHRGWAVGIDGIVGWRANWEDWGYAERAERGRDWRLVQAYAVAGTGVGLNERYRLIGSLHAGWGGGLDRFSRPRLGGGPGGEEYLSLARARIPGVTLNEFTPAHYAVLVAEYRYELFFFTYLSGKASTAWVERDRLRAGGIRREDDVLSSVGTRLTTGFLFDTRLDVEYNYNFDVIRDRDRGGNEWIVHVSGEF